MASSRSSSSIEQRKDLVVHCLCNFPAKTVRAWTDKNPGRRFYTCRGRKSGNGYDSCKFFEWFDSEPPHGWQHEALLEAKDVMARQREEIKALKHTIASLPRQGGYMEVSGESELVDECANLKREVLILAERSMVYRNVLITSSLGFTVAIGVLLAFWK